MSIESLVEIIHTSKPLTAVQAVRELGMLHGDARAAEVLIEVLYHGNIMTQQAAAVALVAFNNEAVAAALCKGLKEGSAVVRLQIVKSLETLNRTDTIPCLMAALTETDIESLQYTIIEALGNMKAVEACGLIASYCNHPNHHVSKRARTAFDKITLATRNS